MIDLPFLSVLAGGSDGALWSYVLHATGASQPVQPPVFEIENKNVGMYSSSLAPVSENRSVGGEILEWRFAGNVDALPEYELNIVFRASNANPFLRFRYELRCKYRCRLTKSNGRDALQYCSVDVKAFDRFCEVRVSEFNELYHSFCLVEIPVVEANFSNSVAMMGPIFVAENKKESLLLAYEHGSQLPDRFIEFAPTPEQTIKIHAVKGSYFHGQEVGAGESYATVWMQIGMAAGGLDDLAKAYRDFVLTAMAKNSESRSPYIFYNTWNFQERNQDWNKQPYLASMNTERILAEIDVAAKMGIDVFVLDTGWYEKTGDWMVSKERFPGGLTPITDKLNSCGMKLGLWFNPTVAAVTSKMHAQNKDCLMSRDGKVPAPSPIWETEASQGMCLVSHYADAFADELIRLHNELGVTYFKWDAIGQYGCNDAGHRHGGKANSETERSECYAFQLDSAMVSVVERLASECPDVIVDFDITEGGRCVGLSFLAVGKYFLINNGPYYPNYDISTPEGRNVNMFFFPGPARGWICRAPLNYDKWIPSVLFLTHYFPDDPEENQWLSLASLMLGQNGIWGDLLSISEPGIERFGRTLSKYKQVRNQITSSSPITTGAVGGSPEVHEKIADDGCGIVSLFAAAAGTYEYVTEHKVNSKIWFNDILAVKFDGAGRAIIRATFTRPSAGIVLFGVNPVND
jgi:alpha-galactosidase